MSIVPIKTSFFLKKKTGHSDIHTLFFRMSHLNQIAEISLKFDIEMSAWDKTKGAIRTNHPEYTRVHAIMDQIRMNALNLQQDLILKGRQIDVHLIKEKISGNTSTKTNSDPTFLEIFEKIIKRKTIIGGNGNTAATIQKYKRCKCHLINFLELQYKSSDIRFDQVKIQFLEDFEIYMRAHANCSHNTTMKYIQTLKTIFRQALAHGIIHGDPFLGYKISMQEVNRDYLTEEELNKLINFDLPTENLRTVRTMFVFSCFTGLAYIDLKNLKMSNIIKENGRYWIRTHRQKTNVRTNVPLLPLAAEIIKKFHAIPESASPTLPVLKVISNQKANKTLKKIASLVEIEKELTFHIARHTFATTITLSNGVPIESVSKMLGHKRIVTTQHYAKMLDKKVEEDMNKLSTRLESIFQS
jgi:site-specific recombinase XerD